MPALKMVVLLKGKARRLPPSCSKCVHSAPLCHTPYPVFGAGETGATQPRGPRGPRRPAREQTGGGHAQSKGTGFMTEPGLGPRNLQEVGPTPARK